jgi:hypothetical protein
VGISVLLVVRRSVFLLSVCECLFLMSPTYIPEMSVMDSKRQRNGKDVRNVGNVKQSKA